MDKRPPARSQDKKGDMTHERRKYFLLLSCLIDNNCLEISVEMFCFKEEYFF